MSLWREWPATESELVRAQYALADTARAARKNARWTIEASLLIGGCFIVFQAAASQFPLDQPAPSPAHEADGEMAWAAAVTWRPASGDWRTHPKRRSDRALKGAVAAVSGPRRANDVQAHSVVQGTVTHRYRSGLLALRAGPLLAAAVNALDKLPDVLVVDATGLDHPRQAGLAVHLGAAMDIPTVGVTHRPMLAIGGFPLLVRGERAPAVVRRRTVAYWVCTRTGGRPVLAHAGWRTDADTAAQIALLASTEASRTPVPLAEARRVAREARAQAAAV